MKKLQTLTICIICLIFFVKFVQYMAMMVMMGGIPEEFRLLQDFIGQQSGDKDVLAMVKSSSFQRIAKDVPIIFSSIAIQRDLDFCLVICFLIKGVLSIWPRMIGRWKDRSSKNKL